MDPEDSAADNYIKTTTGNYVSRKAEISQATHVEIKGRSWIEDGVVVRGDLAKIRMGRYCQVSSHTILEPAPATPSTASDVTKTPHVPVSIGSHTVVGSHCHIRAAAIGSYCWIGPNVKMGARVIVKDACVIEEGVVLGDDVVIGPFTRVSTVPLSTNSTTTTTTTMLQMMDLPPSTIQLLQEESMETYQNFVAAQRTQ